MNILGHRLLVASFSILLSSLAFSHDEPSKPVLENLLRSTLEKAPNTEIIVSKVKIPPNTSLPKHWHPGEEFGYVIEGSVIHWQEDQEEKLINAGQAVKIPLNKVHTAITKDEGATVIVFRVHERGQPERVLVK